MKLFGPIAKAIVGTVVLTPIALVQDVATLGGTINEGYFRNGERVYTHKRLAEVVRSLEEIGDDD
jgi:hypothetical protein